MTVSFSDHGRIGRALEMMLQVFSRNFGQIWDGYTFRGRGSMW